MTSRFDTLFARLREADRPAFVSYIMGGDPDYDTALAVMRGLPQAGADIIELGMPFSDPMADGPAIQEAGRRALKGGQTLKRTLETAAAFREDDTDTPIVLMGYYNPIYQYGTERFLNDAGAAGIDGLIVVDLPPEMDDELCVPALDAGIAFIRLATPTTDAARLPKVLSNTSGFLYYVSMTGITGAAAVDPQAVAAQLDHIRKGTDLPICVGFGVKTPEHAAAIGKAADGVVVGSAIVSALAETLDGEGKATGETVATTLDRARSLAEGAHRARA